MQKIFIPFFHILLSATCINYVYAESSSVSSNSKSNLTSDINKLVEESQDNLQQINEQIREQAVLKRSQLREEQAKICYEKGLALVNQGRFVDARVYFDKAIKITENSELADNIRQDTDRLNLQEEALFKARKEMEAENKENEKIMMQKKADEEAKKTEFEEKQKQKEAQEQERQKKIQEEQQHREQLKQEQEEQAKVKERLYKQADSDYEAALNLYRDQKFVDAKDKFQIVNQELPHYKAVDSYLRKVDRLISRQQKQKENEARRLAELQRKQEEQRLKDEQKVKNDQKRREELKLKEEENLKAEEKRREEQRLSEEQKTKDEQKRLEEQKLKAEEKQKAEEKRKEEQRIFDEQKAKDEQKLKEDQQLKNAQNMKEVQRLKEEEAKKTLEVQKQNELDRAKIERQKQVEELQKEKDAKELLRKSVQTDYLTAVDFYKERKYKQSKDKFDAVQKQMPGYKSTASYLKRIDVQITRQELKENQEKQKTENLKLRQQEEQRKIEEKHQKWIESQKKTVVVASPISSAGIVPVKNEVSPLVIVSSAVATDAVKPTVNSLTTSNVQNPSEDELLAALAEKSSKLFNQISDLAPDKDTIAAKNKLAKVDAILNNRKKEKELVLIQQRQEEERKYQQELKEKSQLRSQDASRTYDQAIELLSSKDFENAKKKFLEVEILIPNYKSTQNYLKNIDEDQRKMQEEAIAEKARDEQRILREEQKRKREEQERLRKDRLIKLQTESDQIAKQASLINDEILRLTVSKNYSAAKSKFEELEETMKDLKIVKDKIATEKDESELVVSQVKESEMSNKQIEKVLMEKRLQGIQLKNDTIYKKNHEQDEKEAKVFREREVKHQQEVMLSQGVQLFKLKKYSEAKVIFTELSTKGDSKAKSYLKKINQLTGEHTDQLKSSVDHDRSEYLTERLNQQRLKRILDNNEQERQRKLSKDLEKQKEIFEQQQQYSRKKIEQLKIQENQRERLEEEKMRSRQKLTTENTQYQFRKVPPATLDRSNQIKEITKEDPILINKLPMATPIVEAKIVEKTIPKVEERSIPINPPVVTEDSKELLRIQQQKKADIEKSLQNRKQKLENERLIVHSQLEKGVESMYREALKLYKSGNYQAAATRFSDIQDLIPGYKNSIHYLNKAQTRSIKTYSIVPVEASQESHLSKQSFSKDDQIAKTLDLFDK